MEQTPERIYDLKKLRGPSIQFCAAQMSHFPAAYNPLNVTNTSYGSATRINPLPSHFTELSGIPKNYSDAPLSGNLE